MERERESGQLKTLFIAVIINLYDPKLLTGIHSETMRNGLAEELSGLLQTRRDFISQIVNKVKTYLNPHRPLPAYEDFKNEANKISKVLGIEFGK